MRFLRAVGALLVLLLLVLGVPLLLLQIGNPGYLLEVNWADALWRAANPRAVLALLSVVAWLAWGVLTLTVLAEVVAVLSRQRVTMPIPGTGWLRPGIGALVVAALAVPTVASADTSTRPLESTSEASTLSASSPAQAAPAAPPEGPHYVVQPGDELWSVAERELGSGDRWRDIVALNSGLTATSRLAVGTMLTMPAATAAQVQVADAGSPVDVVVESGDTLWGLAEEHLGDGNRWPELHEANKSTVADPDVIDVGWELTIPTAASEPAVPIDTPSETVEDAPEASPVSVEEDEAQADEATPPPTPSYVIPPQAGIPADPDADAGPGSEQDADADEQSDDSADAVAALLGTLGAGLAAAVAGGLIWRRRNQLLSRRVGERLVPLTPEHERNWGAVAHRAEEPRRAAAPESPTELVLGWGADDAAVTHNLEAAGLTVFTGAARSSALGAAITSLTHQSPSSIVLVGSSEWAEVADTAQVQTHRDTAAGLSTLQRITAERRLGIGDSTLDVLRANPDTSSEVEPLIFVFTEPLATPEVAVIADALDVGHTGVSVLGVAGSVQTPAATVIEVTGDTARLGAEVFEPQLLTEPAKHAVLGLLAVTATHPESAPWWNDAPNPIPARARHEDSNMTAALDAPAHPTLLLLGDVELLAAAGETPTRATTQCLEYCAWLLNNPGATPTKMAQHLAVAETTRRSNMSRLRTWLGADDTEARYLPDAYSGRITLDERVTSDWEVFQAMLSGGVRHADTEQLRRALTLVRGEPLGHLAFQWFWAETMRADMVAMVVDAAAELADRCLADKDFQGALWAVERGRLAAPLDDELAVRRIDALSHAGDVAALERDVMTLTRALRADSRDLAPELAQRVQRAISRARRPSRS